MPYARSSHKAEFDKRTNFLLRKARKAERVHAQSDPDLRDLVFQCAVFQTSAATETYLRLLIETWIQKLKASNNATATPHPTRAFITTTRLTPHFANFQYNEKEDLLLAALVKDQFSWPAMANGTLPNYFNGKQIHTGTAYPTLKNLVRLFGRAGILNFQSHLDRTLKRDVEILIEEFQGVRTAIAHDAPPTLALGDIERLLAGAKSLVGAIDRIFFKHVMQHGGPACW